MKTKKNHVYKLIRKKDMLVLILSAVMLSIASISFFFIGYADKEFIAVIDINEYGNVYGTKLDPNYILSHTGIWIIIYLIICIAVIIYNKHFLESGTKSKYLVCRVPKSHFYIKTIAAFPIKCAIAVALVMVLLEVWYIDYTLGHEPELVDLSIPIDYIRILF